MSEGPIGQESLGGNEQGSSGDSINPAWNDLLKIVPQELHSQVTPHLRKWDQGVQQRFQQIHDGYKPYKTFQDAGYDPSTIETALGILQSLNTEPRKIYDALAAYHGWAAGEDTEQDPQQQIQQQEQESPENRHLRQQVDLLSNILLQQHSLSQQEQEDAALDDELNRLTDEYGEFDERFVLGRIMAGQSPEDAVKEFHSFVNNVRTQRPRSPQLLSSGGNVPQLQSNKPKPGQETRNLVADMLKSVMENQ